MPLRDTHTCLQDILNVILESEKLQKDAGTLSGILSNNYYVRTSKRCLQITGEALSKADVVDRSLPISNKSKIIGLRHVLSHDYELIRPNRSGCT